MDSDSELRLLTFDGERLTWLLTDEIGSWRLTEFWRFSSRCCSLAWSFSIFWWCKRSTSNSARSVFVTCSTSLWMNSAQILHNVSTQICLWRLKQINRYIFDPDNGQMPLKLNVAKDHRHTDCYTLLSSYFFKNFNLKIWTPIKWQTTDCPEPNLDNSPVNDVLYNPWHLWDSELSK